MLDLCNATQESFSELKETNLDKQFALKREDHTAVQTKILSYIHIAKNHAKLTHLSSNLDLTLKYTLMQMSLLPLVKT